MARHFLALAALAFAAAAPARDLPAEDEKQLREENVQLKAKLQLAQKEIELLKKEVELLKAQKGGGEKKAGGKKSLSERLAVKTVLTGTWKNTQNVALHGEAVLTVTKRDGGKIWADWVLRKHNQANVFYEGPLVGEVNEARLTLKTEDTPPSRRLSLLLDSDLLEGTLTVTDLNTKSKVLLRFQE